MRSLIELKLSAKRQFQDRPGACKLIETAVSRGDQTMAQRWRTAARMIAAARPVRSCGVLLEMADPVVTPKTKVKTKTERPRLHKVILSMTTTRRANSSSRC
jgi:hypothetical protein